MAANFQLTSELVLRAPSTANVRRVISQINNSLGGGVSVNVSVNAKTAVQNLGQVQRATKQATNSTNQFGQAVGLAARRFAAYAIATTAVIKLSSAISDATREALKFELELTKISQVQRTNVKNLTGLNKTITNLSRNLGISATELAEVTRLIAQTGRSGVELEQVLSAVAKSARTASFDDMSDSAEGLIAVMEQFGLAGQDAEGVIASINSVSKRFAVESKDIVDAVKRAGGVFSSLKGDVVTGREALNQFIALFTSVRSTTRESAETIATGFRTIFARVQRPRVIKFFRDLGIQLEDAEGRFVGAFEAVQRINVGLQEAGIRAGDVRFAEVAEQLGGLRQISRVLPLLTQYRKQMEALAATRGGIEELDADVDKQLNTMIVRLGQVREDFQALLREVLQTKSFQALADIMIGLAESFIEVARAGKELIPILTVLGGGRLLGTIATGFGTGFLGGVLRANTGGVVPGFGNKDTVPALLTPGEVILNQSQLNGLAKMGLPVEKAFKAAGVPGFQTGGTAGGRKPFISGAAGAGLGVSLLPIAIAALSTLGGTAEDSEKELDNLKEQFIIMAGTVTALTVGLNAVSGPLRAFGKGVSNSVVAGKNASDRRREIRQVAGPGGAIDQHYEGRLNRLRQARDSVLKTGRIRPQDRADLINRFQRTGAGNALDEADQRGVIPASARDKRRDFADQVINNSNLPGAQAGARNIINSGKSVAKVDQALVQYARQIRQTEKKLAEQDKAIAGVNRVYNRLAKQAAQTAARDRATLQATTLRGRFSSGLSRVGGAFAGGPRATIGRAGRGIGRGVKGIPGGFSRLNAGLEANPAAANAAIGAAIASIAFFTSQMDQAANRLKEAADKAIELGDSTEAYNKTLEATEKSQSSRNVKIGAAIGGAVGSIFGPLGTVVGVLVGSLLAMNSTVVKTIESLIGLEGFSEAQAKGAAADAAIAADISRVSKAVNTAVKDFDLLSQSPAKFDQAFNKLASDLQGGRRADTVNPVTGEKRFISLIEDIRRRGRPAAERLQPTADKILKSIEDQVSRQIQKGFSVNEAFANNESLGKAFQFVDAVNAAAEGQERANTIRSIVIERLRAEEAARQRAIQLRNAEIAAIEELTLTVRTAKESLRLLDEAINNQRAALDVLKVRLEATSGTRSAASVGSLRNVDLTNEGGTQRFEAAITNIGRNVPGLKDSADRTIQLGRAFRNLGRDIQIVQRDFNAATGETELEDDVRNAFQGRFAALGDKTAESIFAEISSALNKSSIKKLDAFEIEELVANIEKKFATPLTGQVQEATKKLAESLKIYAETSKTNAEISRKVLDINNRIVLTQSDNQRRMQEILGQDQTGISRTARAGVALQGTGVGLTGNTSRDIRTLGANIERTNRQIQTQIRLREQASRVNDVETIKKTIDEQNKLNTKVKQLTDAMDILADTTNEVNRLEKRLNESREKRGLLRDEATSFAFGTQEQRQQQVLVKRLADLVARTGNVNAAPEAQRANVLALLQKFSNSPIFSGATGQEVINASTGQLLADLGVPLGQINNVMDEFIQSELDIASKIDNLFKVEVEQLQVLKKIQQGAAPAGFASGGVVYAQNGGFFKPKGTDTIPAMLTPGEFVVNKKAASGNMDALKAINSGKLQFFQNGGEVGGKTVPKTSVFGSNVLLDRFILPLLGTPRLASRIKLSQDERNIANAALSNEDDLGEKITTYGRAFGFYRRKNKATAPDKYRKVIDTIFKPIGKAYDEILKSLFGRTVDEAGKVSFNESVISGVRAGQKGLAGIIQNANLPDARRKIEFDKSKGIIDRFLNLVPTIGMLQALNVSSGGQFERDFKKLSSFLGVASQGIDSGNQPIQQFNTGGLVGGRSGVDRNLAMLTKGEFVINKDAAQKIGLRNLMALNNVRGFQNGGANGNIGSGGGAIISPESIERFNASVAGLAGGIPTLDKFSAAVDKLVGFTFTMEVAPMNVNVNLNSAEILSAMGPAVKDMVLRTVGEEIAAVRKDIRFGNV